MRVSVTEVDGKRPLCFVWAAPCSEMSGNLAPSYIVDAIRTSGPRFGIEADRRLGAVDMAK
jgi:hypothetical protein